MAALLAEGRVRFGSFVLDPGEARLVGPQGQVHLGRKAFRLLETLIAEPGHLVTKEALFRTVWDGTIVSESALTAAIKELRRALGDEAKSPSFIESVYGRGYRFIAPVVQVEPSDDAAAAPAGPSHVPVKPGSGRSAGPSRRAVLGWGALAAGAATLAVAAPSLFRPGVPPEVQRLVVQARHLLDQNTYEAQNEAAGMLRRVVALAPGYADGWGLLGMAYGIASHYRDRPEGLRLRARARAAGERALELDARNGYGELALGIELPFVGHWMERDERLARAAVDLPNNDDVLTFTAVVLQFNGRSREAVAHYQRIRQRPLTPAAYSNYIRALWSAERMEEADRALDDAIALYPTQATLWFDRFNLWMFSGRTDAAIAFLTDRSNWPSAVDDTLAADLLAQARAVGDPTSRQARETMEQKAQAARTGSTAAQFAIRLAGALGATDAGFAVAEAYYFSRGYAVPDSPAPGSAASTDQRQTRLLFEPETASLRADPRFERLVAEIGLARYWRSSGRQPDYRRAAAAA